MLTPTGRASAKAQILDLLSAARKTRDVSMGETTAKINALRYALDQFGANILDYYGAMEKFLPGFFRTHLARKGERTKDKVEKQIVEQMLSEQEGVQLVALLMQCIESRTRRAQFLQRHFKKEKAREAFKSEVKQIQATHMQLARTFDTTATKYERVFSVNTFLTHYGSDVNNEETLKLLGDIDLNDEGDLTLVAPPDAPTEILREGDPALEADISEDYIIVKTGVDVPDNPPLYPAMPEDLEYAEDNHHGQPDSLHSYEEEEYVEVEEGYDHIIAQTPIHEPGKN